MSLRVLKRRKDLRRGMIDPLNHQTLRIMILSLLDLRSRSRKLLLLLLQLLRSLSRKLPKLLKVRLLRLF
jgi:hypothetical protein